MLTESQLTEHAAKPQAGATGVPGSPGAVKPGPRQEARSAPSGTDGAPVVVAPADRGVPGARLERLAQRRRLLREELIVVVVLFVLLAATVAILAAQWLASGPSASALHHLVQFDPGGTT